MIIPYNTKRYDTMQCNAIQHSTAQHSTMQHSTMQHSTAQYSTVQYSTTQHNAAIIAQCNVVHAVQCSAVRSVFFSPNMSLPCIPETENEIPQSTSSTHTTAYMKTTVVVMHPYRSTVSCYSYYVINSKLVRR